MCDAAPKHGAPFMLLTGALMMFFRAGGGAQFKELWLAVSLILFIAVAAYGAVMGVGLVAIILLMILRPTL